MDFEVNGTLLAQALALAIEVRIYLEYWPLNITGWPLSAASVAAGRRKLQTFHNGNHSLVN